jgi:septal ring factor EnvC (AmiA/AmiB activator)
MSKSLTKKISSVDSCSFEKINKFNVAIMSLKNQLRSSNNIDELTLVASKIIDLEHQIVIEKTTGYKQLEEEKKTIEYKIDKIRRDLKNAENDLHRVGNNIDLKLVGYKNALQMKIDLLNDEYNLSVERMNLISNE